MAARWHSDGRQMALGRHSDGTQMALGRHSDGTRTALGLHSMALGLHSDFTRLLEARVAQQPGQLAQRSLELRALHVQRQSRRLEHLR